MRREELFWLLGAGIVIYWGLAASVTSRLKTKHHILWETLGSPAVFPFPPDVRAHNQFLLFIVSLKYLATKDAALIVLCLLMSAGFAVDVILFLKVF